NSFLGATVEAASYKRNEIQLSCDPKYLYTPAKGALNYSSHFAELQPDLETGTCALYTGTSMSYISVDPCDSREEGSCLAGFSASVKSGSATGEAFIALGLPGSYIVEGNIYLAHFKNNQLVNSVRLKNSQRELSENGFNLGYSIKLAHLNRLDLMLQYKDDTAYAYELNGQEQSSSAKVQPFNVISSSSAWEDNHYRGIVMIVSQAMDLGG
ncbi:Integrin, alpha, partial [Cichlidogyrus casuarinus]